MLSKSPRQVVDHGKAVLNCGTVQPTTLIHLRNCPLAKIERGSVPDSPPTPSNSYPTRIPDVD